ncbi:MAG: DUF3869 domain-containing protein [Bacteroidales bacterium]|nr:DUF3869 domain-containing protein [Bacteroidales bacterium]
MKKFLLYVASFATIAFTGCSKEQSELSIDDVQAKATISGKVTYDGGSYYDKTDAATVLLDAVAASNVTVVVKVNNKDYNGTDGTYQYFETKTDENGNFSIDVPVYIAISNAEVYNLPFYAEWTEDDNTSGEHVKKSYSNVLMKMTKTTVSANEKDVKYVTIKTSYESKDQFKN